MFSFEMEVRALKEYKIKKNAGKLTAGQIKVFLLKLQMLIIKVIIEYLLR